MNTSVIKKIARKASDKEKLPQIIEFIIHQLRSAMVPVRKRTE